MRFAIALVFLLGCFEHHVVEDGPRVDASRDVGADAQDSGICLCASDLDCPPREGCIEHVCSDCLCQPRMVPRCDECMCMTDADCPPPPPFGDCIRTVCTECICTFIADDAVCGADGFCDPDTFLCSSASTIDVEVILRTDYEPAVEFDRITVFGGMDSLVYLPAPDDPFLTEAITLGTLRLPSGDVVLTAELSLGESLIASRDEFVFVEEGAIAAFTVAR